MLERLVVRLLSGLLACSAVDALAFDIGAAAPPLRVGKFLQGEPFERFDTNHIYVIDFWATWCGSGQGSTPILNRLHDRFSTNGLIVLGVDCREPDAGVAEDMIRKILPQIRYTIALDDTTSDPRGVMASSWLTARGAGIPVTFVVDRTGRLAWLGNATDELEKVIEQLVAGTFDPATARQELEAARRAREEIRLQMEVASLATERQDWSSALKVLSDLETRGLSPDQLMEIEFMRLQICVGKADVDAALASAQRLVQRGSDRPQILTIVAAMLATDRVFDNKTDLALAEKAALAAVAITQESDPIPLAALARVRFRMGQQAEAVKLQERAVELSDGPRKEIFSRHLEALRAGRKPDA